MAASDSKGVNDGRSATSSSVIPTSSCSSSITSSISGAGTTREAIIQKLRSRFRRRKQHNRRKGGGSAASSASKEPRKEPTKRRYNNKEAKEEEGDDDQVDPLTLPIEEVVHRSVQEMWTSMDSTKQENSSKSTNDSAKNAQDSNEQSEDPEGGVTVSIQAVFRETKDSEKSLHFNSILEHLIYRVNSSMMEASACSDLLLGRIERSNSPDEKLAVVRCIDSIVTQSESGKKGRTVFLRRVDSNVQKLVSSCIKILPDKSKEQSTVNMQESVKYILVKWSDEYFPSTSNVSLALVYLRNQGIIKRPVQSQNDRNENDQHAAVRNLLMQTREIEAVIPTFNKVFTEILNLIQALLGQRYYSILLQAFPTLRGSEGAIETSDSSREKPEVQHQENTASTFSIDPRYAVSNSSSDSDCWSEGSQSDVSAASNSKEEQKESEQAQQDHDWSSSDEEEVPNESTKELDIYDVFVDESGAFDYDEYKRWEAEARRQLEDMEATEESTHEPEGTWEALEAILPLQVSNDIRDSWKECQYNVGLLKETLVRLQEVCEQLDPVIHTLGSRTSSDQQEHLRWRFQQSKNMRNELSDMYHKGMDLITASEIIGIQTPSSRKQSKDSGNDGMQEHGISTYCNDNVQKGDDSRKRKRHKTSRNLNNSSTLKAALGIG